MSDLGDEWEESGVCARQARLPWVLIVEETGDKFLCELGG